MTGAFNTGFGLNIEKLHESSFGRLVYNPERFAGGILHYASKKSIMIFHTGAVTMSGCKSIKELEDDYGYILYITQVIKK